jgi:hypothetical protein
MIRDTAIAASYGINWKEIGWIRDMKNYSLEEAKEILGCSRREVQNLINGNGKSGALPRLSHFQIGSKKMVRETDLDRLIEEEMRMGDKPRKEWEAQHVQCV